MCYTGACIFENNDGSCNSQSHSYQIASEIAKKHGVKECDIGCDVFWDPGSPEDRSTLEDIGAEFRNRLEREGGIRVYIGDHKLDTTISDSAIVPSHISFSGDDQLGISQNDVPIIRECCEKIDGAANTINNLIEVYKYLHPEMEAGIKDIQTIIEGPISELRIYAKKIQDKLSTANDD